MAGGYKIAVLGPVPRDHITTYQGEVVEKYGCALYTAVGAATLAGPDSRIVLVTHVRKADRPRIARLLAPFPNIETGHISDAADRGDVISLVYLDQNRRSERQTGFMAPITIEDVADLLDFDAYVFVPITDFEVSLETLRFLKKHGNGVIVFDAHGPTNVCTLKGERLHKLWIDRDLWLPYIDILKMNLEEAGCSWFEAEYDPDDLSEKGELPTDQLPAFAAHCLSRGVKAVYVTLDEGGSAVFFNDAAGRLHEEIVPRVPVDHVVDTTGCGDSFAGGLAFGYLKTGDFIAACRYANALGAQRCTGTELAIYKDLKTTERQIAEAYGA